MLEKTLSRYLNFVSFFKVAIRYAEWIYLFLLTFCLFTQTEALWRAKWFVSYHLSTLWVLHHAGKSMLHRVCIL